MKTTFELKSLTEDLKTIGLLEGADWVKLKSIKMMINSFDGSLMNDKNPLRSRGIEIDDPEWKALYKKASVGDKRIMDSIKKEMN